MCVNRSGKLLSIMFAITVLASSPGALWAGTLVDDLANAQLEKQIKEARGEDKPKAPAPVIPNLPRAEKGKPLTLVAVYGLGDRLMADIECQGAVFAVKAQDTVDGWTIKNIYPSRVIMEKKGQKQRELTLAIRPGELSSPGLSGAAGSMPGGMVPPPPPPFQ